MIGLDCQFCGACCVNPSKNREEKYDAYIEVEPKDGLRKKPELMRRYTVDIDGVLHLKLLPKDGRCAALRGRLGGSVHCTIYAHRPTPCRRVEPGSDLCLSYRRDHGLG
jgi:Fe-S-cluster containining protein